ncbi:hypothetical protein X798_06579 [Onchocerca flexuosa]|uniref:Autophagy-related protein 101 n=1 Tax=Onchocerca flexuosa TaxID=387005 RepID=A0A238BN33_9BILA|nr:hypothetical protein X798_06579 [Onchocerca flexuosa]
MNARNHQFQLTVDEHQVRDAISTVFHTILLHRSVPKMHYTSEINFQLGSIGVEEVDCNTLNLSYVRVNSSKLVSCLHEEIDAFVQCIRHSIESVTAPRFYSPPPVSLLTHYGTPLLNANFFFFFFLEYWERMREEVADSVSEIVLKACSLISRPQYMPQMPARSEVTSIFDTSYFECQPYLFRIIKHPLDSGQSTESTLMTIGASAVKKMLRDTFLS